MKGAGLMGGLTVTGSTSSLTNQPSRHYGSITKRKDRVRSLILMATTLRGYGKTIKQMDMGCTTTQVAPALKGIGSTTCQMGREGKPTLMVLSTSANSNVDSSMGPENFGFLTDRCTEGDSFTMKWKDKEYMYKVISYRNRHGRMVESTRGNGFNPRSTVKVSWNGLMDENTTDSTLKIKNGGLVFSPGKTAGSTLVNG